MRDTEISREEFYVIMGLYWQLINEMPIDLQEVFPHFDRFISPVNYSMEDIKYPHHDVELSLTGARRMEMLRSPHANTLLRAWAIKRKEQRKRNYEG